MWSQASVHPAGCIKVPDTSLKNFGLSRYYRPFHTVIPSIVYSQESLEVPIDSIETRYKVTNELDVGRLSTLDRSNYLGSFKFSLRRRLDTDGAESAKDP
jgi:hypothetical protein